MATFLFVPGAFHGGWCFDRLRPLLEAAGHRVHTPTLTGVGERAHLAATNVINLDTHIEDIVNMVRFRDLDQLILCGHSYGCFVIRGVADRLPERISTLVYIDGPIPEDGDTMFSRLPVVLPPFMDLSARAGGHMVPPPPAEAFGVGAEYRAWVDAKLTAHPLASLAQAISLSGAHTGVRNHILIYNTDEISIPSPIPQWYEAERGKDNVAVFPLSGGHDLMIDRADELARILIDAAV